MIDIAKLDIDHVVANSFRDFHVKGFDYICLERAPAKTVKLYFFDGDVTRLPEVINPHNHRYDFLTEVVCGAVANKIFAPATYGDVFQRFKYATPLNGGNGFTWDGESRLIEVDEALYEPDGPDADWRSYFSPAEAFHTISIRANETVLKLTQFDDRIALDHPTLTFCKDREPPRLDGLYRRFTADEVIKRLEWLNNKLSWRS